MSNGVQTVQLDYVPRQAFKAFHQRTKRSAVIVAHRRAGKTYSVIQDLVARALNFQKKDKNGKLLPRPKFAYLCPFRNQAKQVAWQYLVDFTKAIPGVKKHEQDLWIEIPTVAGDTARIFLAGADNPDALRGLYFDGVVLDEYGDMRPDVYSTVIRPALSDRIGWVVFMGTPKGKNDFYRRWELAQANPDKYFSLRLKASQSGLLPASEIEAMREEMEPEEVEQELECSFEAAFKGAYYGKQLYIAESQGKFRTVEYDPEEKVSIAMDLGHRDAAVIWFWQVVDGEIRFIDYWEQSGFDAEEVCEMLALKPYDYETVWLPHDALHHTFATKKSVLDTFLAHELPARKVPNADGGNRVMNGIVSVRQFLRLWHFAIDPNKCRRGIEAIKNYSRKFSRATATYLDQPSHDEWSHGADAFRYAVLSIQPEDLDRSVERMHRRRINQVTNRGQLNTSRYTLDEAFAAREREQAARRRNIGRAWD